MAQAITGPMFGHFLTPKDMIKEIADKTTTAAFAQIGRGARWFFCRVYQKAFTSGSGSVAVQYLLEVASDSGFSTDVATIALGECERADEATVFLIGFSPLLSLRYCRVRQIKDGSDTATFDAKLDAMS